jgi:dimeric dUTPase (all-alpha-NTP-PPase superfamily)
MINWKLEDLLKTQSEVRDEVMKKLKTPPTKEDHTLAMHIELFELFNEIGTWKWWKHSHIVKKDRILDELADVIAFFLSYMLLLEPTKQAQVALWMDDNFDQFMDPEVDVIRYVSESITEGQPMPPMVLMIAALAATIKTLNCEWTEIVYAYNRKSEVNIERQKNNY